MKPEIQYSLIHVNERYKRYSDMKCKRKKIAIIKTQNGIETATVITTKIFLLNENYQV